MGNIPLRKGLKRAKEGALIEKAGGFRPKAGGSKG